MAKNLHTQQQPEQLTAVRALALCRALPAHERLVFVQEFMAEFGPPDVVMRIERDKIKRNPRNPRKRFNEHDTERCAQSLRLWGQRAPLQVIPNEEQPGTFLLIDGERRWRAAESAGLADLRCVVEKLDERDAMHAMVLSHADRIKLTVIERAKCLEFLVSPRDQGGMGMKNGDAALLFGLAKGQSVPNERRLLDLPPALQELIENNCVHPSAARDICTRLEEADPSLRAAFCCECARRFTDKTKTLKKVQFVGFYETFARKFKPARLTLAVEENAAYLDGVRYQLKPNGTLLLKLLLELKGGREKLATHGFQKPARDLKGLPQEVRSAIDNQPRHGMCIRKEYL